jgi:hypothetical protein
MTALGIGLWALVFGLGALVLGLWFLSFFLFCGFLIFYH